MFASSSRFAGLLAMTVLQSCFVISQNQINLIALSLRAREAGEATLPSNPNLFHRHCEPAKRAKQSFCPTQICSTVIASPQSGRSNPSVQPKFVPPSLRAREAGEATLPSNPNLFYCHCEPAQRAKQPSNFSQKRFRYLDNQILIKPVDTDNNTVLPPDPDQLAGKACK